MVCLQVAAAYYNLLLQDALLNLTQWQAEIATQIQTVTARHPTDPTVIIKHANAQVQTDLADCIFTIELYCLIGSDRARSVLAVDQLVVELAKANKARSDLATAEADLKSAKPYKLDQLQVNVDQAGILLAMQQQAREVAAVQLLNAIGLPTKYCKTIHLADPLGFVDNSEKRVREEPPAVKEADTSSIKRAFALQDANAIASNWSEAMRLMKSFKINPERFYVQPEIFGLGPKVFTPSDLTTIWRQAGAFELLQKYNSEKSKVPIPTVEEDNGRMVSLDKPLLTKLNGVRDKLIDLALHRRPDIAIQYAAFRQSVAQSHGAYASIWPSVSLTLTGQTDFQNNSTRNFEPSNEKRSGGFGRTDGFMAAVMLSFTAFDGFNLISKYNASKESIQASWAGLATSELSALSDLVINIVNYDYAVDVYNVAATGSREASEALAATQAAQRDGQLDSYLDAINAQTALFTQRVQQAKAAVSVLANAYLVSNSTGMALRFLDIRKLMAFSHGGARPKVEQLHVPTINELKTATGQSDKGPALPNVKYRP
jgi:hypothetical protein